MPCENCGGAVEIVDQSGGTKEGRFRERYKCVNCGGYGIVRGDAEEPASQWVHTGTVFNA
jgi:hypothetical protein